MSDSSDNSTDSGGGGDAFTISPSEISFANNLALYATIPGTCTCFLVLVSYAFAALMPRARKKLDRVSFRLLACTLVFNVLFGIAYAATPASPGPGCNFGAFAVNFFLSFSTFFTTCIALNLQLVLVHGVNGKRMEKYYVLGTVVLALALNVPTFALHQFGWDEGSSTCWYKNPDPAKRLRWIIGTQSFWIALAATIETVCSGVVLAWMYRFHRITQVLVKAASDSSLNRSETTKKSSAGASWLSRFARPSSSSAGRSTQQQQLSQDPRYRNMILRIALYPVVSLVVNYSTVALDLNNTIRGLNSQLDYRLLVLDLIMYGIRTLAYGVLAATDPAFIGAVREMRGGAKEEASGKAGVRTLTTVRFATGRGKSEEAASAAATTGQGGEAAAAAAAGEDVEGSAGREAEALDVEEKRRLERQL